MRILQISTHLNIGGIGNYILSLSSALKSKGAYVIVASSGGNLETELSKYGIGHEHLDIKTKFELSPKVFKSAFALAGIIKREKIDIIHAHSRVSQAVSFFASRMTGTPFITTCHGYFKKRGRGIFDTWGEKVVAISDAVRTHLIEDLGVKSGRIELIYSGVDVDRFSKRYSDIEIREMKKGLGLKNGPIIGTIGRLSSVKGQKFLIEAMRDIISKIQDAQCLIVGSGDEESDLKELAASLNIEDRVYFVPSDPDTGKFLQIMDVFVFPSIKEGLGIALLEAMAAGLPCVASRVGGISDIITNESDGMLVEACDARAITGAVLLLLKDPVFRNQMGNRAGALVAEKFSLSSMADKTMILYRKILEERK